MKTMLLTAAVVALAIAGLVVHSQEKNKPSARLKDAADDAYDTMNEAIGSVERPFANAMG